MDENEKDLRKNAGKATDPWALAAKATADAGPNYVIKSLIRALASQPKDKEQA